MLSVILTQFEQLQTDRCISEMPQSCQETMKKSAWIHNIIQRRKAKIATDRMGSVADPPLFPSPPCSPACIIHLPTATKLKAKVQNGRSCFSWLWENSCFCHGNEARLLAGFPSPNRTSVPGSVGLRPFAVGPLLTALLRLPGGHAIGR
jgi:hypothetical protein